MRSIITRQEGQLIFRVGASFRFDESGHHARYGNSDKYSLTKRLIQSNLMHCPDRGRDEFGEALDINDVESCGGVFRLPYYSMLRNEKDLIRSSDVRQRPRRDSLKVLNCIVLDRMRPYMEHYHWTLKLKVRFRYLVRAIKKYG
eukprot:GHVO01069293.1.p1 GENE.GHVO01069293.1~~GHVO01069293.1.p1  ORF type:complete len:144 (+),score=7.90 GHVO01069293.1:136-567(+)